MKQEIHQDFSLLENINFEQEPVKKQPDVIYIYLEPAKNEISVSQTSITFPGNQPIMYYSREHLYSLLFSSQPECINNIIQQEIKAKTTIYQNKIAIIQGKDCDYSLLQGKLQDLLKNPSTDAQDSITELNKELINKNCPAVF